jgi:hypothetical protein
MSSGHSSVVSAGSSGEGRTVLFEDWLQVYVWLV